MDGLFAQFQSPAELEQARQQQLMQQAQQYGQLGPLEAARASQYAAGAQIGQALGGVRPADVEAQKRQETMMQGEADLSTSKGLYAKAEQFRQAGDQRTAFMLLQKAKEVERQEAAAMAAAQKQALEERKQNEAEAFRRDQMSETMQMRRDQLTQAFEIAKMRSEDNRLAASDRAAAMREANAIRLQIAQMMAASKQAGTTPAQSFKEKQARSKASTALVGMESDLANAMEAANKLKSHPGLERATGMMGNLPSVPGGKAAEAEALLEEFKNQVKLIGLNLSRQGGGLGAMTEKEWPIVEGMVANIDPKKLSAAGVKEQINKVIAKMQGTLANAKSMYEQEYGDLPAVQPSAPAAATGGWSIRPKGQ